jgi:uncharacterized protein (DUF1697 family)
MSAKQAKAALEKRLESYSGKPIGVLVRTADELAAVLKANPFKKAAANRTVAIFLDERPPADALRKATGQRQEEMRLGTREIFVHYIEGIGRSKLKIPAANTGTAPKYEYCRQTDRDGRQNESLAGGVIRRLWGS